MSPDLEVRGLFEWHREWHTLRMDADRLQAIVDRYARGTFNDDDARALLEEVIYLRDRIAVLEWRLAS